MFCLLIASGELAAQGSMLRIGCEGESVGAEVSANGVFKGECPLDMSVPAGVLKLRVVKKVDAGRVRVFEQELRLGDGVVKRVEVVLGAPQLTPEGRKQEEARIAREQAAAQAREEQLRQSINEANARLDQRVSELLQARRAQRAVQTPDCPDCPLLVLPGGGGVRRPTLPVFADAQIEAWKRNIEQELRTYLDRPQEAFRLPGEVQPWPCEGAEAGIRRLAGLVNFADETPQNRESYRAAMKPFGAGESSYYYRDVRMWPVQMRCTAGKLDGPVDVWVYSVLVADNPNHLSVTPRLSHLRFTAAAGELAGPLYQVSRTDKGIIEYKDAAANKLMKQNATGDFEVMSFSYSYPRASGVMRGLTVSNSSFANAQLQEAGERLSSFLTLPLGEGRSEQLYYDGMRLASRALQKDGRNHGPMTLFAHTIKTGPFAPDVKVPESVICYRDGQQIQAKPCNVQ